MFLLQLSRRWNIILRRKWTRARSNKEGWSTKLSDQHPLYRDLLISYSAFKLPSFTTTWNFWLCCILGHWKWWEDESAQVSCWRYNRDWRRKRRFSVRKNRAILRHQANDAEYIIFFVLKCFQATNNLDQILSESIYEFKLASVSVCENDKLKLWSKSLAKWHFDISSQII